MAFQWGRDDHAQEPFLVHRAVPGQRGGLIREHCHSQPETRAFVDANSHAFLTQWRQMRRHYEHAH
jgi:hypothetical protein